MYSLSDLKAPKNSRHSKKRVGRGQGSGWGKTAGRGGKGQKARTGNMHFEGFEGGQMPMQRRFPKFGFFNPFRRDFAEVNLSMLDHCFDAGDSVDPEALVNHGIVKDLKGGIKILGNGQLSKALKISAHRVKRSLSPGASFSRCRALIRLLRWRLCGWRSLSCRSRRAS